MPEKEEPRQRLSDLFPIERSDYYNFYLLELKEIEKNKLTLSEQMGYDVGFEYARWNWITTKRILWLNSIGGNASGVCAQ